ncbi:MAG TPA: hypothetical protein VNL77_23910 [Roseiflexaceae bacterium]|nr:hypothetical protein [Roseiflexaceae bacterium]
MKRALRALLAVAALLLAGLPVAAALLGRDALVLPLVALALAALCSFLAYRGAVLLRRRIDAIGAASRPERRHPPDR